MLPLFLPTLPSQAPETVLLPVSLEPTEWAWVWFRSKDEFSSLLKQWRNTSSLSRGPAVPTGCGRGCFIGSPQQGGWGQGGALPGQAQPYRSGSRAQARSSVSAHGRRPSWIEVVCAAALLPTPRAEASCTGASPEEELWSEVPSTSTRPLHAASCEQVKPD